MTTVNEQNTPLDTAQLQQAQALFEQAFELPIDERDDWLTNQTNTSQAVISKVQQLIRISNRLVSNTETPAGQSPAPIIDALDLALVETNLGHYQLIKSLGQGGMGRVYLAQRNDNAFDKLVVVKLMKGFHRQGSGLQRFHFERQILAKMEHPNIAHLLDGGQCKDGTPFYVMEYVDGYSITEYCQQESISIRERIELFQKICAAVHYAHQNLIIHRDLKPNNILVNQEGEPKLLDFGIAKQIVAEGSEDSPLTRTAIAPMTPSYSSPEQILGQTLSTTSDIYSLGNVLYELLTNHHPHSQDNTDPLRLKVAICERDPNPPSKQVLIDTQKKAPWSKDLDNIVLKALDKAPTRRYQSALQFSDDLQNYKDARPISASRQTWLYRSSKFIRRQRWASAIVAIALLLLGWQQIRVLEQRNQAQENALRAEQNRGFLISIFDTLKPEVSKELNISTQAILDHGAEQLANGLIDQPTVKSDVMLTLANLYNEYGLFDSATKLAEEALNIQRNLYGDQSLILVDTLNMLSEIYIYQGEFESASSVIQNAFDILSPHKNKQIPQRVATLNWQSYLHTKLGQIPKAIELSQQSIAIAKTIQDVNLKPLSEALGMLGLAYLEIDEYKLAHQTFNKSLSLCIKSYNEMHVSCIDSSDNLGVALSSQGLFDEAEQHYLEALRITHKSLGSEHPDVASLQNSLGLLLANTGRFNEAEATLKNAIRIIEESFGTEHPQLTTPLQNLSLVYRETDRLEEALAMANRSLQLEKKFNPNNIIRITGRHYTIGLILSRLKRHEEAGEIFAETVKIWTRTRGEQSSFVASARASLAGTLARQGKYALAEQQSREVLEIYRKTLEPDHWHIATVQSNIGRIILLQERYEEAEPFLTTACQRLFEIKTIASAYTKSCFNSIIELYEKSNRSDQAQWYREQLKTTKLASAN